MFQALDLMDKVLSKLFLAKTILITDCEAVEVKEHCDQLMMAKTKSWVQEDIQMERQPLVSTYSRSKILNNHLDLAAQHHKNVVHQQLVVEELVLLMVANLKGS